ALREDRWACDRRRRDRSGRQEDRRGLLRHRTRRRQAARRVAHGGVPLTAVAYQGLAGAFSEAAAAALFPGASLVPRRTFAEVFARLEAGEDGAGGAAGGRPRAGTRGGGQAQWR